MVAIFFTKLMQSNFVKGVAVDDYTVHVEDKSNSTHADE
jgi:hypothetical protein